MSSEPLPEVAAKPPVFTFRPPPTLVSSAEVTAPPAAHLPRGRRGDDGYVWPSPARVVELPGPDTRVAAQSKFLDGRFPSLPAAPSLPATSAELSLPHRWASFDADAVAANLATLFAGGGAKPSLDERKPWKADDRRPPRAEPRDAPQHLAGQMSYLLMGYSPLLVVGALDRGNYLASLGLRDVLPLVQRFVEPPFVIAVHGLRLTETGYRESPLSFGQNTVVGTSAANTAEHAVWKLWRDIDVLPQLAPDSTSSMINWCGAVVAANTRCAHLRLCFRDVYLRPQLGRAAVPQCPLLLAHNGQVAPAPAPKAPSVWDLRTLVEVTDDCFAQFVCPPDPTFSAGASLAGTSAQVTVVRPGQFSLPRYEARFRSHQVDYRGSHADDPFLDAEWDLEAERARWATDLQARQPSRYAFLAPLPYAALADSAPPVSDHARLFVDAHSLPTATPAAELPLGAAHRVWWRFVGGNTSGSACAYAFSSGGVSRWDAARDQWDAVDLGAQTPAAGATHPLTSVVLHENTILLHGYVQDEPAFCHRLDVRDRAGLQRVCALPHSDGYATGWLPGHVHDGWFFLGGRMRDSSPFEFRSDQVVVLDERIGLPRGDIVPELSHARFGSVATAFAP